MSRRGRPRAFVVVGDELRVEHPAIKGQPIVVPYDQIAAVVVMDPAIEPVLPPLYVRDVNNLRLLSTSYRGPDVVFVLRAPLPVEHVRRGSERLVGLTAKQRKQGAAVDSIGVTSQDPAALAAAVRAQGVPAGRTVAGALAAVVGEPTGAAAQERLRARTEAARKARRQLLLVAPIWTVAFPARVLVGLSGLTGWTDVRIVVAALAWALLLAPGLSRLPLPGLPGPGAPPPGPPSRTRALAVPAVFLAAAVLPLVLLFPASSLTGPALVAVGGLLGGLPGALMAAVVLRVVHNLNGVIEAGERPGGLAAQHDRVRLDVLVGRLVAVGALVTVIATQPPPSPDVGMTRRATLTTAEMPAGWTSVGSSGPLRGSILKQHLCPDTEPDHLPAHTAGYTRQFSYKHQADGGEYAHLYMDVRAARTVAQAQIEFSHIEDDGYWPCTVGAAEAIVRCVCKDPRGALTATYTREPLTIDGSDASAVADRIEVTIHDSTTGPHVIDITFLRMQVGRLLLRMPIMTAYTGIDETNLHMLAQAAAGKALAAQIGLTRSRPA